MFLMEEVNPHLHDDAREIRLEIKSGISSTNICHVIHHYACIGYLLHIYGIELPNKVFGYNPTTPINQPNSYISKKVKS